MLDQYQLLNAIFIVFYIRPALAYSRVIDFAVLAAQKIDIFQLTSQAVQLYDNDKTSKGVLKHHH